jgi:hypothetical protein
MSFHMIHQDGNQMMILGLNINFILLNDFINEKNKNIYI